MKIWINSCHAALEYDHAKIFTDLGHEVSGLFDIGSKQRPKIKGVTDVSAAPEIHEANKINRVNLQMVGSPDVVIVHQTSDFVPRTEWYAKQNVQVVSIIFGQGSINDHNALAHVARRYNNVWIVPYALKEYRMYHALHVPANRLQMIRFAKPASEYDCCKWAGSTPKCFIPCNSIHRRGTGCNWNAVQLLMGAGAPIIVAGRETQEIGGRGEIDYDEYRMLMRNCQCYLHVGTIPAPYTLTLVEAACSGTPVICLDNGHGLRGEEFPFETVDKVEDALFQIRRVLTEPEHRSNLHERSVLAARSAFCGEIIADQWRCLLNNMLHEGDRSCFYRTQSV